MIITMSNKIIRNKKGIIFDPILHKYTYNDKELTSVTTWLNERFVPEFANIFASNNKAKSNKRLNKGITNPIELRKFWKIQGERASLQGSATHKFAEMYHMDKSVLPMNGYERAVIDAYKLLSERWDIIEVERIVYDIRYLLAGQIDLVLRRRSDGAIGYADWKITKDMHKSYNNMKNELKGIKASALNKYAVQLGTYNKLDGLQASHTHLFVIQLHYDGKYTIYHNGSQGIDKLNDFSTEIECALESRLMEKTHPLLGI